MHYYLYNSTITSLILILLLPLLTTPTRRIPRRPPRSPLLNSYANNNNPSSSSSSTDFLSPSLTTLQVVAILPDDTRRSLGLSRVLHKTLNAVTATDLVSQLDFPDRNLTWVVTNFVFGKQQQSPHPQQQSWKQQEDTTYEDDPSTATTSLAQSAASPLLFTPLLLSDLCSTLSETKALAIVSLLPHHSETLLSLVATSTGVPLVATNPNTLSALKEVSPLYINLSQSVRHVSQCVANLLLHCHWHSFTVIADDSPQVAQDRPVWRARLLNSHRHKHNSSTPNYLDDLYTENNDLTNDDVLNDDDDDDYEDNDDAEDEELTSSLLRPKWVTIQTRAPNAPFRVLSELTKATQGVIVLLLSQRSLVRVFHAAKQLRMLTGDYVFILAGANSHQLLDESPPPDWLPHGVLALRPPRPPPHVDKMRMRVTGTALASALTNIKDTKPFTKHTPHPTITKQKTTNMMMGGVFSGFTTRDFLANGAANKQQPPNKPHPPPPQTPEGGDDGGGETVLDALDRLGNLSCFHQPHNSHQRLLISTLLVREMDLLMSRHPLPLPPLTTHGGGQQQTDEVVVDQPLPTYEILNLVRSRNPPASSWVPVGTVSPVYPSSSSASSGSNGVTLQTIKWPGGGLFGPGERPSKAYRVATIVAPPFVMESQAEDNRTCVRGLPCLKVNTNNKDELAVMFADFDGRTSSPSSYSDDDYTLACCDGLAMDLLASVARELKFEIDLFLVPDGAFGSRHNNGSWNGLMGSIVSGAAHMSFAPFSVTSIRETAVDFATPFFFSGVGLLGISKERDVPLLAFLAPFSSELWAAIFITLNLTALVVAVYEWFSPFGLNPWGRQRTKNFSISSALWVVWGRLFSHLVAFKAPKSWPNKFLINVWGGFSVIFVASYTANIAALFAGMFFERHVDVNDRSLLSQRVTAVKHSATDFYIKRENPHLWEHIQQFPVHSFQHGVNMLKNGSLDLLIGDGPLLDYYRGTDSSCSLIDVSDHDKIGDDTYAVAMSKGFPLKESVSSVIAKYLGNGYMDYLQGKWYGQMHCFTKAQQQGARALGVDAVVGMLIMLGVAMFLGILISFFELFIFKHALPYWRSRPKGTLWRSPNVMFFSQKLYRFINCVELVSPHHAAKELANSLRQGQITSLFQKSVKRKEHEQRRRRKSKAQFYEMIQEIKRVQMAEKQHPSARSSTRDTTTEESAASSTVYSIQGRMIESNNAMDSAETACAPPRLCRGHVAGEEILIAEYPTGGRRPVYHHQHSIDDSTCSSAGGVDHPSSNRRIQWTSQFPPTSSNTSSGLLANRVPTPQGILRKPAPPPPPPPPTTSTDPNFSHEDSEEEEEEDSSDLGNGGLRVATNGSDEDSYELYSPLDKANLVGLSKSQIIEMWRASELDLRRQLSQALKAKDQLTSQLNSRSQTPAMLLEFDQVKI